MLHNHDKKYSKILEYPIDLNFLKTMLPDHGMYCEMQLLSLLDFSFTVSLFFSNFNFIFILLEKYLKITHKTCWHIYTRPPIGVTPTECLISCKMCSDKISLKLGMSRAIVAFRNSFIIHYHYFKFLYHYLLFQSYGMHQKLGLTKKVTLQKSSMLNKEQRPPKHKYIMKSLEKRCEL